MDYKEKIDVLSFHSFYTKINGTDAKVLMRFLVECHYKTDEVKFSLGELAEKIDSNKNAVSESIKKLIEQEVIILVEKSIGTKASLYKVSNLERLNFLFEGHKKNPKFSIWENKSSELFGDFFKQQNDIDNKIMKCKNCEEINKGLGGNEDQKICVEHSFEKKALNNSLIGKKYQLWLMDNPEPKYSIKTIKGIFVK